MIEFFVLLPYIVKLMIGLNYAAAGYMYVAPPIVVIVDMKADVINMSPFIFVSSQVYYSDEFDVVMKYEYGKYLQSAFYTPIVRGAINIIASTWSLLTSGSLTTNNFLLTSIKSKVDILAPPKIIVLGDLKKPFTRSLK